MMTGASGARGWNGSSAAGSIEGAQNGSAVVPARAVTLSDVFARLAAALEADAGAPSIEGHVRRYARPSGRRRDH